MWRSERKAWAMLCLVLCIGPVLVIIGLSILLGTNDEKVNSLIYFYDSSVSTWHRIKPDFENAKFLCSNSTSEIAMQDDDSGYRI